MTQVSVSVIVPTWNSERTLPALLSSLRRQTYRNLEILVIDNYSTDKTRKIATDHDVAVITLHSERSVARNVGAKMSNGKFLFFIDSDMEPSLRTIEECMQLAQAGFDAIVIPEKTSGTSLMARLRDWERRAGGATSVLVAPRFVSRVAFEECGGYPSDMVGAEDYEFAARLMDHGYEFGRTHAHILHHEENANPIDYLRKRYYYSRTAWRHGVYHPTIARAQFSALYRTRVLLSHFRKEPRPVLMGLVLGIRGLEYAAFRVQSVWSIMKSRQKGPHRGRGEDPC